MAYNKPGPGCAGYLLDVFMNRYEYDADVKYGSMVVDAKSIVGVLSLARSKTVEVILHTDECQNLLDEIAQFAA